VKAAGDDSGNTLQMSRLPLIVAILVLSVLLSRPSYAQGDTVTLRSMIGQMILLGF
jgi:hypothetical protein